MTFLTKIWVPTQLYVRRNSKVRNYYCIIIYAYSLRFDAKAWLSFMHETESNENAGKVHTSSPQRHVISNKVTQTICHHCYNKASKYIHSFVLTTVDIGLETYLVAT